MNVLVVAAHPDDEVLGCGGTIIKHALNGDNVDFLFMSEGVTSRSVVGKDIDFGPEILARQKAANSVAELIGANPPLFLGMENLRMRDFPMLDIVKKIEDVLAEKHPDIIYTHHGGDLNSDHRITHEALLTACRPMENCSVKSIFSFETPSSTEWSSLSIGDPFLPTRYVNIIDQLDKKLEALSLYDMELRPFPHPRSPESIKAWAAKHGATVGRHAAEAFCVIREIID